MDDNMTHGRPGGKPQRTMTVEELFRKLEGILTLEQLQSIWNATGGNRDAVTLELKKRLGEHRAVLEQRGFVPDYLAYMLPYTLGAHLEAQRRLGPSAMWN
jgi:hypothetical protein